MKLNLALLLVATLLGLAFGQENTSEVVDPDFLEPYIVQGDDVPENGHPYHVSLREYEAHVCGAVILTTNYVISAAHCVITENLATTKTRPWYPTNTAILSVRAGSTELSSGGSIIGVSRTIIHPLFNIASLQDDIALIQLASSLVFGDSVAPIAIAPSRPPTSAEVIVTGWGTTSVGGNELSEHLQQLKTRVVSESECYQHTRNPSGSILCLRSNSTSGICRGDDGGAAVYQGTLVGLAISAIRRCATYRPDGFTYVPNYRSWLERYSDL